MKSMRRFSIWTLFVLFCLWSLPALAATISGTITNSSGQPDARVYVGLYATAGYGEEAAIGTSLLLTGGSGGYTLNGVADGTYFVRAFMDVDDNGSPNIADPRGSTAQVTVSGGMVSGSTAIDLPYTDPAAIEALVAAPYSVSVYPANNDFSTTGGYVLVTWNDVRDWPYGFIQASHYRVEWSNNDFDSVTGVIDNVPADGDAMVFIPGLNPGNYYQFRVVAVIGATSAQSQATYAITPTTPAGGYSVSGTVAFAGFTPAGNDDLIVVAENEENGARHIVRVTVAPAATSAAFTIEGVPPGTYSVYALLDSNGNGIRDLGDHISLEYDDDVVTVVALNVSGIDLEMPGGNAAADITTRHTIAADGSTHSYGLWAELQELTKPVASVVVSGPQIATVSLARQEGGEFEYVADVGATAPQLSHQYTFTVVYRDNTTGSFTVSPSAVLNSPAVPTAPLGHLASFPAMFEWAAPDPPPSSFLYDIQVFKKGMNWPAFEREDLPSSQNAVAYGLYSPTDVGHYLWKIGVRDRYGNVVERWATFSHGDFGTVVGRVTDAVTGAPIDFVMSDFYSDTIIDYPMIGGGITDPSGDYYVDLPPDLYVATFFAPHGCYQSEFYNNKQSPETGDPILVEKDQTTTINLSLSPEPFDDGDGICFFNDNCPYTFNPDQQDSDSDTLGDACDAQPQDGRWGDWDNDGYDNNTDNCPEDYNPGQEDTDGNGVGDLCDPGADDNDGDGIPDYSDNCRYIANADQANADDDGYGDPCDNCPQIFNTGQADADLNGIGDACEAVPNDSDFDGIPDGGDNCPLVPNIAQVDADNDGLGDLCDNCPNTPNPDQADSNGNQIGDACESAGPPTTGTVTGTVTNGSGQSGRIYLRVYWSMGGQSNFGVSIPAAGEYAMRGVQASGPGSYTIFGFVDQNGDGIANATEASGWSQSFGVNGDGSVTDQVDLDLEAPADAPAPAPVDYLDVMRFPGGAMLFWEVPRDQDGLRFLADGVRVEWSTSSSFATILGTKEVDAGSGWDEEGMFAVTGLTNSTLYYFRVTTLLDGQASTPVVAPAAAKTFSGGYTISGTISLGDATDAAGKPCMVFAEGPGGVSVFVHYIPALNAGTTSFAITNVPAGYYHLEALVDMDGSQGPSVGDYTVTANPAVKVVNAAVTGQTLTISPRNARTAIETTHAYNDAEGPGVEYYGLGLITEAGAKLPVNIHVAGPSLPAGGVDVCWSVEEAYYWLHTQVRPQLTDVYTFTLQYADGSIEVLHASPSAVYDTPGPLNIIPSGTITAMPANITWTPSGAIPDGWVSEAVIWGQYPSNFYWENEDELPATLNSLPYDGGPLPLGQYVLLVSLCEDWNWNCVERTQLLTVVGGSSCALPGTLTVPAADPDGSYSVSWAASATAGSTYVLEEATDPGFVTNLEEVYRGTALTTTLSGRGQGVTYYYRVKATKNGLVDSQWRTAANGCAVTWPTVERPASLAVPPADADGSYTVSWGASATAGATYVLQEATDSNFLYNVREAYQGPALTVEITGRAQNQTYYYRVKATKEFQNDSPWRRPGTNSCAVPGTDTVAAPAAIYWPAADDDGAYQISWEPSATPGATYALWEATAPDFNTGVRILNPGSGTSAQITGRSQGVTYYYRVRAMYPGLVDSAWTYSGSVAVPGTDKVIAPPSLTVPAGDADGAYIVSWTASATPGVSYYLIETTDPTFETGRVAVYLGTATSASLTGRAQGQTYYYRVKAIKAGLKDSDWLYGNNGCAVPGTVAGTPASLTVKPVDADGTYAIDWTAPATALPPAVEYVLEEATGSTFAGAAEIYRGSLLTYEVTGREPGTTYFYRVKAVGVGYKDSLWKSGANGCQVIGENVPALPPGALTVPAADADGAYAVSWTASPTKGVTYILEEATDAAFSDALEIPVDTALSKAFTITDHVQGLTYFYRVKAVHPEYTESEWRLTATGAGCAVPGTVLPTPTTIGIATPEEDGTYRNPAVDADGFYRIAWVPAATTLDGVTYVLQQATSSTFADASIQWTEETVESWFDLFAANEQGTYYYRVKVVAPGYKDSLWKPLTTGCQVIGEGVKALPPGALTVPAGDADGAYAVSWTASPTKGVTYILEEATDAAFNDALPVYEGPALNRAFTKEEHLLGTTYFYRVMAVHAEYDDSDWRETATRAGCAVPGTVLPTPASIGVPVSAEDETYRNPAVDADGLYRIAWAPAATTPLDGVMYVLQQATNSTFTANVTTFDATSEPWFDLAEANLVGTYYYRVKVTKPGYKDSLWKALTTGCQVIGEEVKALPPGALTVPVGDADGAYTVSWTASATKGVTYLLEEATDAAFSDAAEVYSGPALKRVFLAPEHAQGTTYFYRVKAVHAEYTASDWRETLTKAGCAVPGTVLPTPASIGIPVSEANAAYRNPAVDADGLYRIAWAPAATTPADVMYVLQQATTSTFTANVTTFDATSEPWLDLAAPNPLGTYYYRVKVTKPGYKDSVWKVLTTGCKVIGEGIPALPPGALTVPVGDADGAYTVSWTASPTKGTTYVLEEATDAAFSDVLPVYEGPALSKVFGLGEARAQNKTYYYRVKAVHPEYAESTWRMTLSRAGCAVPGTLLAGTPASITVPATGNTLGYTINWGASPTLDAGYVVEEATNSTFTANVQTVYAGPEQNVLIEGRTVGTTYFYRVRAVKSGVKDSAWKTSLTGCKVVADPA